MRENRKELTGYPSIDKPWLNYYSEKVLDQEYSECKLYEALYEANKDHKKDIALEYFGRKITYGRLFECIEEAAQAFYNMGVRKGNMVSLCVLTMPETIYTLYGLNKIGAVCNLIEPRVNTDNIRKRIVDTKSKILVTIDVFYEKVLEAVQKTDIRKIIVIPISESMPFYKKALFPLKYGKNIPQISESDGIKRWEKFIKRNQKGIVVKTDNSPNDTAVVIYTGGTTGIPKGAKLSDSNINWVAYHAKYSSSRMARGDIFLDIMPPFIAYGLTCGIHAPLLIGMRNILIPKFSSGEFDSLLLKYKPNHVVGVPSFFESLLNSSKIKPYTSLAFLKTAIAGGDKLLVTTEEKINAFLGKHNCPYPIAKGYGMTELSSGVAYADIMEANKPGGVGIPFINTVCKIVNPETGEEVPYNRQGEVCFCGPTVMQGYFENTTETNCTIRKHSDGRLWVHTQDIGYIDEDGVLFIVDRLKRMIIRPDGHNVFPVCIEEIICKHEKVAQCAVVGLPNPNSENGHIPTAFVVLKKQDITDKSQLMKELDKFCRIYLPERDVAERYVFVEKLPITLVGKVDYRKLEEIAEDNTNRG